MITYWDQEPYLASGLPNDSVIHKTTDFTRQSLEDALTGADLVISTVTAGDDCLQRRIIEACVVSGVKRVMANEFGLDSQNKQIQERLPAYNARSRVIDFLRDYEDDLEWTAIAVGTILDHELLNGKLGFDLMWQSASIPGDRTVRFPATSLSGVGELVAATISNWAAVRNSYIYAAGCMTTADEVVQCLKHEMKADWVVDSNDPQEMVDSAQRMLERGWPDAGWSLMERIAVFDPKMNGAKQFVDTPANKLFGLQDERIADIIHDTVHQWKHTTQGDCGCN